jgi:hypothetical protein
MNKELTEMVPKKETETKLRKEFNRQVENLVQKGYPKVAGVKSEEFVKHIEPLKERIRELATLEKAAKEGCIPFVIVVKNDLVAPEKAMLLVEREGKKGLISMYPVEPKNFKPIEGVQIPAGMAYLLVDIDRGKETLNVTPDEALKSIAKNNRSPLTIDEGLAIITHYPEFLQKNNCFSLLASRSGDKRVPALWLSEGKPKLGWCWAGNPHSWLGSASCGRRVGA